LGAPESALLLGRVGVGGQAYSNLATFNLSRYTNSGVNAKTQLDIALNDNNDSTASLVNVISFQSGGNVGIGNTGPAYLLHVGSTSASGIVAEFQNSAGACTLSPSSSSMVPSCSSDIRLKSDVTDAGDALAWIDDMRVRDFTIKSTGERKTGVIAQEMISAHPDMVHPGSDDFYKVDGPDPWKLVKAVQQLKAENADLIRRDDELEREITELRREIHAQ
jgi:hypothetical protein